VWHAHLYAEGQHEAEQVVKKFIAMEEEMNAAREVAAQVGTSKWKHVYVESVRLCDVVKGHGDLLSARLGGSCAF
jgi:hypothetical protein